MKNFALRLTMLSMLLCAGCAPQIYTRIQNSYPANVQNAKIALFDVEQETPAGVEVLGDIKIKDSGSSLKCDFPDILQLAEKEINSIGGNALKLTWHSTPSSESSPCHQIAGFMLRLPDSLANRFGVDITSSRYSLNSAKRHNQRKSYTTLHVSTGYAFVVSRYTTGNNYHHGAKIGWHLEGGVDHVFRSGFGFGVRYSGYKTTGFYIVFPNPSWLHYIGPEAVFRFRQRSGRKRWEMNTSLGCGYVYYCEKLRKLHYDFDGYGFNLSLGGEYRITRQVGIGVQSSFYMTHFTNFDQAKIFWKTPGSGISYINISAGIRLHF